MDVRFVDASGAHVKDADDVIELLLRDDGFVWVDVPTWDDNAEAVLEGLGCHPQVLESCRIRNHVPTVHAYDDHWFVTMHTPLIGARGHVHLLELDQIVGDRFLVTVHGPLNPVVAPEEALTETAPCWGGSTPAGSGRPHRRGCRTPWPRRWRAGSGP